MTVKKGNLRGIYTRGTKLSPRRCVNDYPNTHISKAETILLKVGRFFFLSALSTFIFLCFPHRKFFITPRSAELRRKNGRKSYPSDRRHGRLAKNHGKSLASLAKILPWSYQDLAKDTMIMQDCAKGTILLLGEFLHCIIKEKVFDFQKISGLRPKWHKCKWHKCK